ncbi:MAG: hypothetical protein AB7F35_00985 [Acetobacteraceae bacterium]
MTFAQHIAAFHHREAILQETFERQGYLLARSQRDPGYTILLKPGTSDAAFEVHSFRDGQPVGHRDYDRLSGGSPVQNALQEFMATDMKLETKARPAKGVEWSEHLGRVR